MKLTAGVTDWFPPPRRHRRDMASARQLAAAPWPARAIATLLHGDTSQFRDHAFRRVAGPGMRANRVGQGTAESAKCDAAIVFLDIDDASELSQHRRRDFGPGPSSSGQGTARRGD